MRWSSFFIWLAVATALPQRQPNGYGSPQWIPASTNGTDELALQGLLNLEQYLKTQPTSNCTLETAYRRKEWDSFKPYQKRDYIKAVRCLQTLPTISDLEVVPGARSRYDDFVAAHINQTLRVHQTGNFLTWHRYYVYTYEKALREECGYHGYQPYVDWGRYANGVIGAPLFDGSELSISGNGAYKQHPSIDFLYNNATLMTIEPQQGGGCVTDGPFVNHTINLGPAGLLGINDTKPNPLASGYGYNPRCMRRDLNVRSALGADDYNNTKLITQYTDIASFQDYMQGPFTTGIAEYGVHTAGHYIVGGDPGGDFYVSPGDPWFWFHHAQVDRTYWIWQNQDLETRARSIAGTITLGNVPPSRNATLEDEMDLGVNDGFEGITIGDAMSTMGGPFCYIYE